MRQSEPPDFQQIGDLTRKTVRSLSPSASPMSTERPTGSATTGSPSPGPRAASTTGQPPGEIGCDAPLTATELAKLEPVQVEASLSRQLSALLGSQHVVPRNISSYGSHGFECSVVAEYVATGPVDGDVLTRAIELVEATLMRAPDALLLQALTKVEVSMIQRHQGDVDLEFRTEVLLEDLSRYPADVALDALDHWRRTEKYFPTIAELSLLMDGWTRMRRARLNALRKLAHA